MVTTLAQLCAGSTGVVSPRIYARGGGVPRRPSTNPVPAGATDAGSELEGVDGQLTRPSPWFVPPAGATDAGCTPHSGQARPSLNATNRVPSFDFTRISTVRLPSFCALPMTLRTSPTE